MTIVTKISKPTKNVLTVANTDLIFNSELATHAIHSIVNFSFTSGTEYTVTHNLGYIPKVWVYGDSGTWLWRIPVISVPGSGFDYYITSTTIVVHRSSDISHADYIVIIFTRSANP